MKNLLCICFFFLAVSCSKNTEEPSSNASAVYIKVKIEGTEYKFEGKRTPAEIGCAFVPDGGNTGFRLVGYDGTQYVNFWVYNTPINNITTTTYTYSRSNIDWNLNGYNISGNLITSGSLTLTINNITNGKHSGTFSGTVVVQQTSSGKTVPVTGEFNNVEIVQ